MTSAPVDQIQAAPASMEVSAPAEVAAPTSVVNTEAQESKKEISVLFKGPGVAEAWVCSMVPQGIMSPSAPAVFWNHWPLWLG